jgi:hypothetical protein
VPDPKKSLSSRWWFWALLGLLIWWLWSKRCKPAAPTASSSTPATTYNPPSGSTEPATAPPSAPITGTQPTAGSGYGSFNGYMPGDVGDSALLAVAPETISMLNSHSFWSDDPNDVERGQPLYDVWKRAHVRGDSVREEQARELIREILDPSQSSVSGLAAQAAAASAAGNIASSVVHTEPEISLGTWNYSTAPAPRLNVDPLSILTSERVRRLSAALGF